MARILAFDYGKKRVGVAVTDPLQMIASGLDTIDTPLIISFTTKYIQVEKVESFVVGIPKTLSNEDSSNAAAVQKFITQLKGTFPDIPIFGVDERFTSSMAFQTMIDSGINKKARRDKATVDKISATIILQSYLEQKAIRPPQPL